MNPCCCLPPKQGISLLAIIDGIQGFIAVIFFAIYLAIGLRELQDDSTKEGQIKRTILTVISVALMVGGLFNIGLGVFIRICSRNNDKGGCIIWLWINGIIVIGALAIEFVDFYVISKNKDQTKQYTQMGVVIAGVIYKSYQMLVVLCFSRTLGKTRVVIAPVRHNKIPLRKP